MSSPHTPSSSSPTQQQQQQLRRPSDRESSSSGFPKGGGGIMNPASEREEVEESQRILAGQTAAIHQQQRHGDRGGGGMDPSSPVFLALGLGHPVPLSTLAIFFESFGEAEALDCSRMLMTDASDINAVYISFFDTRITEGVYNRFREASVEEPRCAAISRAGASKQQQHPSSSSSSSPLLPPPSSSSPSMDPSTSALVDVIAITSCRKEFFKPPPYPTIDPRLVDIHHLCWRLPEAIQCCSEFGALASVNGGPVEASPRDSPEICQNVKFYDSRSAEAFRGAIEVLEGAGSGGGAEEAEERSAATVAVQEGPNVTVEEGIESHATGQPVTTITRPFPPMATHPVISEGHTMTTMTPPSTGTRSAGESLLTTQQQQQHVMTGGHRFSQSPSPPKYLTSQVARSLARFYRGVGMADFIPTGQTTTTTAGTSSSSSAAMTASLISSLAGGGPASPQATSFSALTQITGFEEALQQSTATAEQEQNLDRRTTVMVRNIPPAYTSSKLLQEILETMLENSAEDELSAVNASISAPFGIDFVYLPFNLKNRAGVSYGFVNLATSEDLDLFYERFNQHVWRSGMSRAHNGGERKPCEMSPARLQGQQALIEAFVNRLHAKSEHIPLPARPLIYDPTVAFAKQSHSSPSAMAASPPIPTIPRSFQQRQRQHPRQHQWSAASSSFSSGFHASAPSSPSKRSSPGGSTSSQRPPRSTTVSPRHPSGGGPQVFPR